MSCFIMGKHRHALGGARDWTRCFWCRFVQGKRFPRHGSWIQWGHVSKNILSKVRAQAHVRSRCLICRYILFMFMVVQLGFAGSKWCLKHGFVGPSHGRRASLTFWMRWETPLRRFFWVILGPLTRCCFRMTVCPRAVFLFSSYFVFFWLHQCFPRHCSLPVKQTVRWILSNLGCTGFVYI